MFSDYYQVDKNYALRKISYRDAKEITVVKKANRKYLEFLEWSKTQEYSIEETFNYIGSKLLNWQYHREWTYEMLKNDKIIGDFQIRPTKNPHALELGYWIDYKHREQGITSLMVKFICEIAKNLNYKIIVIIADEKNVASINLAKKLQFTKYDKTINEFNNSPYLVTYFKYL